MNSQILIKLKSFMKNKIIELCGILLIACSAFIITSIISYSPEDPNFIYTPENIKIKNIGGFYGSVVSDFLLQSIGLISILVTLSMFFWGVRLVVNKKITNFISRLFFVVIYVASGTAYTNIVFNDSFWLIDNGNGGFVGRIIKENIYRFNNLIEIQILIYFLILLIIIFFLLSLNLKISEVKKILLFPYLVLKIFFRIFRKSKKHTIAQEN